MNADELREIAHLALDHPDNHEWTLQGLGMLRTYLTADETLRLHVWNPSVMFPEVSVIHDHPWDFTSWVLYGKLVNVRYTPGGSLGQRFQTARIQCGAGGCQLDPPRPMRLAAAKPEVYIAGDSYSQRSDELHESRPEPGCVSVIERRFGEDRDTARVAWLHGDWVSAEPRPATVDEVHAAIEQVQR